jgi:2-methylisocitrate lyase-like PEP mutase family enzyme
MTDDRGTQFRALHASGTFVMPNPWDVGSARLLASLGFPALATTSSGHAATLGRSDQHVTRDELLAHAEAVAGAVDVPLNVDAERCFADDPAAVARTVELIGETGAAGCSLEDYDPAARAIEPLAVAAERVAAAADAAKAHGIVLTARAENHLYGHPDLDDTIARLQAYAQAGAEVLYAPGLARLDDIARVVAAVDRPINVLALPTGPTVAELASVGVRRISTGGLLARAAYGALVRAATELRDAGTSTYSATAISSADLATAFGD